MNQTCPHNSETAVFASNVTFEPLATVTDASVAVVLRRLCASARCYGKNQSLTGILVISAHIPGSRASSQHNFSLPICPCTLCSYSVCKSVVCSSFAMVHRCRHPSSEQCVFRISLPQVLSSLMSYASLPVLHPCNPHSCTGVQTVLCDGLQAASQVAKDSRKSVGGLWGQLWCWRVAAGEQWGLIEEIQLEIQVRSVFFVLHPSALSVMDDVSLL